MNTYDAEYRLATQTTETIGGQATHQTLRFQYDPAGNRTSRPCPC